MVFHCSVFTKQSCLTTSSQQHPHIQALFRRFIHQHKSSMERCALLPFFLVGYASYLTCIKVGMVKVLTKKKLLHSVFTVHLVRSINYISNLHQLLLRNHCSPNTIDRQVNTIKYTIILVFYLHLNNMSKCQILSHDLWVLYLRLVNTLFLNNREHQISWKEIWHFNQSLRGSYIFHFVTLRDKPCFMQYSQPNECSFQWLFKISLTFICFLNFSSSLTCYLSYSRIGPKGINAGDGIYQFWVFGKISLAELKITNNKKNMAKFSHGVYKISYLWIIKHNK